MKEHAFFMFRNHPMIELFFENERLVAHKDLDYVAPVPHINWAKGLTTSQLEEHLLEQRPSYVFSGSMSRYLHKQSDLTPYQEMRRCRGVSYHEDNDCWIKYDYDNFTYEELLIKLTPPEFRPSN